MSQFARTKAPIIFGSLCAILLFANTFFDVPGLSGTVSILRNNTILVAAFALGLGVINLMSVNYKYYTTRREGLWWIAPVYIFLFPVLGILGIIRHPIYNLVYTYINVPVSIALTSFVSFFIVQGMYRTLKIKNVESLLITVAALLVMMRKIPLGVLIWAGFEPIGDWLLFVTGVAGIRALLIVYGFGIISIGLRAILGHERSQIGIIEGASGEEE